jgi:hypothetical protein
MYITSGYRGLLLVAGPGPRKGIKPHAPPFRPIFSSPVQHPFIHTLGDAQRLTAFLWASALACCTSAAWSREARGGVGACLVRFLVALVADHVPERLHTGLEACAAVLGDLWRLSVSFVCSKTFFRGDGGRTLVGLLGGFAFLGPVGLADVAGRVSREDWLSAAPWRRCSWRETLLESLHGGSLCLGMEKGASRGCRRRSVLCC